MSSTRALANHSLYLAKIQLSSWVGQLEAQQLPVTVVAQAFMPAVRGHLLNAYGYLLLTLIDASDSGEPLPQCVAQLPAVAPGKASPGTLNELQRLEQEGWLKALLELPELTPSAANKSPGNLASAAMPASGVDEATLWCNSMEKAIETLGDSLDEC